MNLILEYTDDQNKVQEMLASSGSVTTVGRSPNADYVLAFDPSLADVHFALAGAGSIWTIRSINRNLVTINSAQVDTVSLKSGDEIRAGNTVFHARFDDLSKARSIAAPSSFGQYFPVVSRLLSSGLTEHRVQVETGKLFDFISQLPEPRYLVVNRKRIDSFQIAGWKPESPDLFEQAPDEIRMTDSLFIGKLDLESASVSNLEEAFATGAVMLLSSSFEFSEILKRQKIAWAWFSRAKIFQQQIVHGSRTLANVLFSGIQLVLLRSKETTEWTLYSQVEVSLYPEA